MLLIYHFLPVVLAVDNYRYACNAKQVCFWCVEVSISLQYITGL